MAKVIKVPPQVPIPEKYRTSEDDPKESTFKEFVETAMNNYMPSGRGINQIRQAQKIMEKVEKMDGQLILEDAEFNTVKEAVMTAQFPPRAARTCLSFFEAVEAGKDVKKPDEK